jgi:hypothetical protein
MRLAIGNNQKAILKGILWDYLEANKGRAKTNKIIRREYVIIRKLHDKLVGRRRTCCRCGQEVR